MPVSFTLFRIITMVIAVFSQVYLFVMVRRAVLSLSKPALLKSVVVWAIGLCMVALSILSWHTLTRPMRLVEPSYLKSIWLYYLPAIWVLGSVLSAAVLVSAQILLFLGKTGLRGFRSISGRTAPPPDPDRRAVIQASLGVLATAPLLITGYGALDEAKSFHVREISVPFGRKLRIALLSDIHSGIYMTRRDIRRCADMVTALKPDLFFMTGDYISNSIRFLPACLEELSRVGAAYGTYACLGNHEHWHGEIEEFERIFLKNEIILLNNSHKIVNTSGGPLGVVGIEDLVAGDPDLEKAISGIEKGIPRILLSHRPEIFPEAASKGISLTLAGHYHGGQIALKLPGLKFSVANLQTHYTEGLFQIKDSYMYVTTGIGTTFTPVRLNAPPEITLVNLA